MKKVTFTTNKEFTVKPTLITGIVDTDTNFYNMESVTQRATEEIINLAGALSRGEIDIFDMRKKTNKAVAKTHDLTTKCKQVEKNVEIVEELTKFIYENTQSGDVMNFKSLRNLGRQLGLVKKETYNYYTWTTTTYYAGYNYVREALKNLIDMGYIEIVVGERNNRLQKYFVVK